MPKLVNFAKEFFGCKDIKGVPIENGGGSGSAGSHFEKTFFPFEFMNPGVEWPAIVSDFSKVYFESTNQYFVKKNNLFFNFILKG